MFSPVANLLIAGIYYVLIALMVFFSAFAVYILIRYGEKRTLALLVSLIFSFFFLSVLVQSYVTLQTIL